MYIYVITMTIMFRLPNDETIYIPLTMHGYTDFSPTKVSQIFTTII